MMKKVLAIRQTLRFNATSQLTADQSLILLRSVSRDSTSSQNISALRCFGLRAADRTYYKWVCAGRQF